MSSTPGPQSAAANGRGNMLVLNAGSSSLKFASFNCAPGEDPVQVLHGAVDAITTRPRLRAWADEGGAVDEQLLPASSDPASAHQTALQAILTWLTAHRAPGRPLCAVHRVVHGGTRFTVPVWVDDVVLAQLQQLVPLAPLHQPYNLAAIRAVAALQPGLPQVACFDTAFHSTQPWVNQAMALPRRITETGVRRYGFHGLSYAHLARVLPQHLGPMADGKVVVAHLGNGASLCAMQGRRSQASTMGFTALDGLMMGTRCGSLDPGVLLYLMHEQGLDAQQLQSLLYQESGLLGVSGLSSDMRVLEASHAPEAEQALALYAARIGQSLGAMAATLGGLDALVFTAGIGENSAAMRARVAAGAAWLGAALDEGLNADGPPARRISRDDSRCALWVVPTDEALEMARQALVLAYQQG